MQQQPFTLQCEHANISREKFEKLQTIFAKHIGRDLFQSAVYLDIFAERVTATAEHAKRRD